MGSVVCPFQMHTDVVEKVLDAMIRNSQYGLFLTPLVPLLAAASSLDNTLFSKRQAEEHLVQE